MPTKAKTHSELERERKGIEYERPRDNRPSAARRGYGSRWRKLRLMQLRRYPLCQWPGCNKPATDVDHIVPRASGGTDDADNLQSLCHAHHSVKTATQDGGGWGRGV